MFRRKSLFFGSELYWNEKCTKLLIDVKIQKKAYAFKDFDEKYSFTVGKEKTCQIV